MAKRKRRSTNDTFLQGMGMGVLLAGFVLLKAKYGQPQKAEKKDEEPAPVDLQDVIDAKIDFASAINAMRENDQLWPNHANNWPYEKLTSVYTKIYNSDPLADYGHYWQVMKQNKEEGGQDA